LASFLNGGTGRVGAYFRANEGGTTEVSFRPFFRGEGFLFFIKQAVTTHKKLPKKRERRRKSK
jgi:hypothetical protein